MNYHILTSNDQTVRVVMHFDVPGGTNLVGTTWVTALLNSGLGGTTILIDGDGTYGTIASDEKANIVDGTVFEHEARLTLRGDMTNAERLAALDMFYIREQQTALSRMEDRLRYFGYTGDVP